MHQPAQINRTHKRTPKANQVHLQEIARLPLREDHVAKEADTAKVPKFKTNSFSKLSQKLTLTKGFAMITLTNALKDIVFYGSLAALPGVVTYYLSKVAATRKVHSRRPAIVEEVTIERID